MGTYLAALSHILLSKRSIWFFFFFENGQGGYNVVAFGLLFFKVVKTFTGVGGFLMMHNFTSGHHLQHHRISCFLKATQNVTKVFQIFGMGIDIAGKIRKIGF